MDGGIVILASYKFYYIRVHDNLVYYPRNNKYIFVPLMKVQLWKQQWEKSEGVRIIYSPLSPTYLDKTWTKPTIPDFLYQVWTTIVWQMRVNVCKLESSSWPPVPPARSWLLTAQPPGRRQRIYPAAGWSWLATIWKYFLNNFSMC